MRFSSLFIAVSAAAGLVAAQNNSYTVDPNSVSPADRNTWCRAQRQTCPQLCGGAVAQGGNDCDVNTLRWTCECANGQRPNVSEYGQTVPSFMCERWRAQCVQNSGTDAARQQACNDVPCGTRQAESVISTSSASASSTGASSTTSGGASATSGAAAATSAAGAAALAFAKSYGTGAVAAGLLGLFGFAL